MKHCVEIAESLRKLQAGSEERIVRAQNLDHAARPANALAHMGREPLGGQPRRLWNVDVGRAPAVHLHAQRSMRILGYGLHGNAADIVQSFLESQTI